MLYYSHLIGFGRSAAFPLLSCPVFLPLSQFDFADFGSLARSTDNGLFTAVALTNRLFEILALLYRRHYAGLLDFARKTAQQVFEGFFGVFAGYLYHYS
jgi:hypothetical protein